MKRSIFQLCLLLLIFGLFSCDKRRSMHDSLPALENKYMEAPSERIAMDMAMPAQPPRPQTQVLERKVIKEGWLRFETESLAQTNQRVVELLKQFSGYLASEKTIKAPGQIRQEMLLRVPEDKFDGLLAEIGKGVDHFDNKQIERKDVTEEFVDVSARLSTKKALEKRYTELLLEAKNVGEALEVERELGRLRADIESMEARLTYLQSQVAYSSLHLTFYESVAGDLAFSSKFAQGFTSGWENMIWLSIILVNIWPFIILSVIIFLLYFLYNKRRKEKIIEL